MILAPDCILIEKTINGYIITTGDMNYEDQAYNNKIVIEENKDKVGLVNLLYYIKDYLGDSISKHNDVNVQIARTTDKEVIKDGDIIPCQKDGCDGILLKEFDTYLMEDVLQCTKCEYLQKIFKKSDC